MEEKKTLKILYLEDNPGDVRLVKEVLSQNRLISFEIEHFNRLKPALERLNKGGIDIILSDLHLPDSQGLNTFERLYKEVPDVPIVVITGTYEDEKMALEAMDQGAQDYLFKDDVSSNLLVRSICYAIERKKLEEAVKEAAEVKARFVSMVSHDLRIPLSSIKEGISLVLDGLTGAINEEQKKILDIVKSNIDRLSHLSSNVLDFQKLEAGKIEFDMQENDINMLVKEASQTMLPLAENKSLDFILNLADDIPRASFDRDKIIQVLTNLLSNAIKFTEKGGITVTTSRSQDAIQVAVADTGSGIKEEDIPKLFREFAQLSAGAKKQMGIGLGLAICRDIIEQHHGRIWVESEFGRGSTFHFSLPIK